MSQSTMKVYYLPKNVLDPPEEIIVKKTCSLTLIRNNIIMRTMVVG